MYVQEKKLTVEDYLALPDDGNDYELLDGELIPMMRPKPLHNIVAFSIAEALGLFVYPAQLGWVATEIGFRLPGRKHSLVFPDVAFVSHASLPNPDFSDYLPATPDLAVEIISPNDVALKVMDKIAAYFEAGTPLVWVAYVEKRFVQVYHQSILNVSGAGVNDTLDGLDVLPGFHLPVRAIFERLGSSVQGTAS